MTKVIFVLRHAQSAGKQSGQQDFERILTAHGESEARNLGKKLMHASFQVDLILASAAAGVVQTVELFNESLQLAPSNIHFKPQLYEALMADWQGIIHELPEESEKVMIAGHNPWLSMLVSSFAGSIADLALCELIGFEFNTDSRKELKHPGRKILHIIPTIN